MIFLFTAYSLFGKHCHKLHRIISYRISYKSVNNAVVKSHFTRLEML